VYQYVSDLVSMTRNPSDEKLRSMIQVWLSPRASIGLIQLAKAKAMLESRTYVIPDDIKAVAHRIMRHRLILSYEALSQWVAPDQCIDRLLDSVAVLKEE
jgi:MoxR-like ATPase